jgi:hypothetical protein
MFGTARIPRLWLTTCGWVRGHAAHLLRITALAIIAALTALAGYTCHGLIGPPG